MTVSGTGTGAVNDMIIRIMITSPNSDEEALGLCFFRRCPKGSTSINSFLSAVVQHTRDCPLPPRKNMRQKLTMMSLETR